MNALMPSVDGKAVLPTCGPARTGLLLSVFCITLLCGCQPQSGSKKDACINNLRQIDDAKEQWALANNRTGTDTPAWTDLVGVSAYLKATPVCKYGGGVYAIHDLDHLPTCTIPGHELPPKSAIEESHRDCVFTLRKIDDAKSRWAMGLPTIRGDEIPAWNQLTGPDKPLKATPTCKSGGAYSINNLNSPPTCSTPGHELPELNQDARKQKNACIKNLHEIDSAREQWALAKNKHATDLPVWADLLGPYLKTSPVCKAGGVYSVNRLVTPPTCTQPGHELPR